MLDSLSPPDVRILDIVKNKDREGILYTLAKAGVANVLWERGEPMTVKELAEVSQLGMRYPSSLFNVSTNCTTA